MVRLLIAIRPSDTGLLLQSFGKDCDVVVCTTLERARLALVQSATFDAILAGVHFDEGRIFDLLRLTKSDPRTRAIPFFCVAVSGHDLSAAMLRSIETAGVSMGAECLFDLNRWRSELGDEAACAKLHAAVCTQLHSR
jgi:hypothetical protein